MTVVVVYVYLVLYRQGFEGRGGGCHIIRQSTTLGGWLITQRL
jgi:hypothetical protein